MLRALPAALVERATAVVAVIAAIVAASAFPISAALRLRYPFEIEWLESELLQHTVRALAGEALYAAPAASFSSTIYPPMFAWVAGLFAAVLGPTMVAPRLVSVLATVAIAALAGLIARRLSGSRAGWFAAALVCAAYVPCGTSFDLARVDSLWVFGLLAASAVALTATGRGGVVAAGVLFALATATKQPTGLFAVAAIAVVALRSKQHAALLATVWLGLTGIVYGALHVATDGWSTTYLVWIPLDVPQRPGEMIGFVRDDILRGFAPSVALLILWALTPRGARPGGALPIGWWAMLAAAFVATTAMRTLQGGALNTLVPLLVFASVMVGSVGGRVLKYGSPEARLGVLVALTLQFGMQTYNPMSLAPSASDRDRGERFVERLKTIPGDVWVPSHTSYAVFAGKPWFVHRDPLLDLQYSGWDAFPDDLEVKLRAGEFAAVIADGPFVEQRIQRALEAGYEMVEELADVPETLVGYRTRPRELWRPRLVDAGSLPPTSGE